MRSPARHRNDDQGAEAAAVRAVAGGSHDGDDLLDVGWIGRVAQAFVAGSTAGVESRHRRRRSTSTSTIEQQFRT
jgi:hypothetical protein